MDQAGDKICPRCAAVMREGRITLTRDEKRIHNWTCPSCGHKEHSEPEE